MIPSGDVSTHGSSLPPDGMDPQVYAMLRSQIKKNDGFGWGPVSNYKPGGGGVNYLNQHKNTIQSKYQDQWELNQSMPPVAAADYQS